MRRLLLITILVIAAVAGLAFTTAGSSSSRSVTTGGHGVVTVVPDEATVDAGVRTQATTAQAALSANAEAMTKVIAALKQVGVKQIQTQQVSLYPNTDRKGNVTSFVAQNTVTAISTIANAGKLIDAAVGAGANTVDGPNLSVGSQSALYRRALQLAVQDARAKAKALAAAGGFHVGRVVTVSESSTPTPISFGQAPKAAGTSTPIEPGTQDITADVQVSFAIS
jgi:uncharacterized protein YggE